jgi:hypothetical protein
MAKKRNAKRITAAEFIRRRRLTLAEFVALVVRVDAGAALHVSQVSRLIRGKQWPTRRFVRAVFKATGGAVDGNAWAGTVRAGRGARASW